MLAKKGANFFQRFSYMARYGGSGRKKSDPEGKPYMRPPGHWGRTHAPRTQKKYLEKKQSMALPFRFWNPDAGDSEPDFIDEETDSHPGNADGAGAHPWLCPPTPGRKSEAGRYKIAKKGTSAPYPARRPGRPWLSRPHLLQLRPRDRREVEYLAESDEASEHLQIKARILLALDRGAKLADAAQTYGVSPTAVSKLATRYKAEGLAPLLKSKAPAARIEFCLNDEQRAELARTAADADQPARERTYARLLLDVERGCAKGELARTYGINLSTVYKIVNRFLDRYPPAPEDESK
jgi:transposase